MMGSRGLRIGLWVLLAVSLIGNAAVLGAIWRIRSYGVLTELADARFPPEIRRDILSAIDDHRDDLMPYLVAVGAARQGLVAVGTATPIDPAALDRAFADLREATTALQKAAQGVMADTLIERSGTPD